MQTRNKPRLGRGLNALISEPATMDTHTLLGGDHRGFATPPDSALAEIPLNLIDENPHQPREVIEPTALADLVRSVKLNGILQPIILKPSGPRYELIAGHRRTAAARAAGLATIPAVVRQDASEEKQAEWALVENIQRQDLNPMERARAYRAYVQRFELTHADAADRLGEDRTTISNFLRLLELNAGVQDLVGRGLLSAGHAKILAGVSDAPRQDALANRCVLEGMSVRKLEEAVAADAKSAEIDSPATTEVSGHQRQLKSAHIVEMEQSMSRKLGTKLRIFPAKRKGCGKIVMQYFSLDEFDRLVEAMGCKVEVG